MALRCFDGGGDYCYNPEQEEIMFIALVSLGSLLVLAGAMDIAQSRWGIFSFEVPHFHPEATILALGLVTIVYAVIFSLKIGQSGS